MNELTTIFRKPIVGDLIYGGDFYYSQITRVGDNVVEFKTIGPIADEDAIRGPKGDKGDQGDTGPQGPQGIPGEVQEQEPWIKPTLMNGWVQEETAPLVYRKNQFGVIEFKGAIKNGNNDSTAFFLPVGYRPTQFETYLAHSLAINVPVQIGVPGGNVLIYGQNTERTVYFNQLRIFTD